MEFIVSACLAGVKCRYDGTDSLDYEVAQLVASGKALPVCPEQLGGLSTPRLPAEMKDGDGKSVLKGETRVVATNGADVTRAYIIGAREALKLANLVGAKKAITKERSPSCGCRYIYRGNEVIPGKGVMVALFEKEGIEVTSV
jgi:uncharacterized protein YbbK (DUF523 family)